MDYKTAIEFLRENNITKEDNSFYEFGEVIFVCCLTFILIVFKYLIFISMICSSIGYSGNG